jgi:phenylalanyl-tRNA synthetase beta chain
MLFSLRWLQELGPFEADADRIAEILTDRGLTVDSVDPRSAPGDVVLDIDVPANRPDCLGHLGVARELAAALGVDLPSPAPAPEPGDVAPVGERVRVEIEDRSGCRRFTARAVVGVTMGPSPDWVVKRLEACGLRTVSNVVDASNLVLLEIGQPIHTYDLDRIRKSPTDGLPVIVARKGRTGERHTTLDQIERELTPDDVVIADHADAVGIGGVMGGASTEIGETTRNVLIEAASFDSRRIRRSSRRLSLQTDASHRFERGVDPEATLRAQEMAVRLICELAGGTAAPGLIDVHPAPRPAPTLELRTGRVGLLLGYQPEDHEIVDALAALGLGPERSGDERVRVTIPSWRVDLEREADLVEEVARHLGYDRIPSHMPSLGRVPDRGTTHPLEERCRESLAHLGFQEAFNYAMLAEGEDAPFVEPGATDPIGLDNPIAEQLTWLRRSVLPGLVRSVDLNLRRGARDVRLFEIGRVFRSREGHGQLPDEPLRVGLAWSGAGEPRHWSRPEREADLADAAGVVEAVLRSLRPAASLDRIPTDLPGLHPGQTLAWRAASGESIAWCGTLHPDLRQKLDLSQGVLVAEIDLDRVLGLPDGGFVHADLPRVPAVTRDLSLEIDPEVTYGRLREVLGSVPSPAPASLEVIDRYAGKQVARGATSLTVRATLQPLDRTLTDDEIEAYRRALVAAVEAESGVRLRA